METKILLIKWRELGDTVILFSSIEEVRRIFPKAKIYVSVLKKWESLLLRHPEVEKVYSYDQEGGMFRKVWFYLKLFFQIKSHKWSYVLNFHASDKSAFFSWLTGAPIRSIHFHGIHDRDKWSTLDIPDRDQIKPITQRDLDTIRALGLEVSKESTPKFITKKDDSDEIRKRLLENEFQGHLLGLGLGASRETKRWPLENFCEIAIRWVKDKKGSVLVFLSEQEEVLARRFRKTLNDHFIRSSEKDKIYLFHKIQISTTLSLQELPYFLKNCSLFIGNDSGPRHLAASVGTPTITFFGPENPHEWHPYSTQKHPYFYTEGLDCRFKEQGQSVERCGLSKCIERKHQCMKEINPNAVYQKALEIYDRNKVL